MTIQDLINELKVIQKEHGDLPVLGACDEEQNCLGDIFQVQVGTLTDMDEYPNSSVKVGDKIVVIVPAI